MITKRIIPCLDVRSGRVVKGTNFEGIRDVADPVEMARMYNAAGADELVFYDITASFEGRNEYISRLCRAPLLILDDFGMERGTEYGLEQVYNVIDSRYRSRRPLIVTTNLSLQDLQHPQDTAHARIYDRLLEMCAPIRFSGENFRKATAQDKLARLKNLMD